MDFLNFFFGFLALSFWQCWFNNMTIYVCNWNGLQFFFFYVAVTAAVFYWCAFSFFVSYRLYSNGFFCKDTIKRYLSEYTHTHTRYYLYTLYYILQNKILHLCARDLKFILLIRGFLWCIFRPSFVAIVSKAVAVVPSRHIYKRCLYI